MWEGHPAKLRFTGCPSHAAGCMWTATCGMWLATCDLRPATCDLRLVACDMRPVTWEGQVATCTSHVTGFRLKATCYLRPATPMLQATGCRLMSACFDYFSRACFITPLLSSIPRPTGSLLYAGPGKCQPLLHVKVRRYIQPIH
jgi:hypothetical protein